MRQPIGGGVFGGIVHTFRSRYLINVAGFLLLLLGDVDVSLHAAGQHRQPRLQRSRRANRVLRDHRSLGQCADAGGSVVPDRAHPADTGVALSLGLLPALTIIGFGAIALLPTVMVVAVFQVLRRAGDYAIARPTRELLFTVVPREDRFKAKSFIDTIVYRTGDQVGAWSTACFADWAEYPRPGTGGDSVRGVVAR